MDIWIWIWVAIIIISLYTEFITMELVTVWFSIGGAIALVLRFMQLDLQVQIVTFFVISFILIISLRKWAKNKLLQSNESANLDLIKSKRYKLVSSIKDDNNIPGSVRYGGVLWTAVSQDGEDIDEGSFVKVVDIKGNKLIVKKENEK